MEMYSSQSCHVRSFILERDGSVATSYFCGREVQLLAVAFFDTKNCYLTVKTSPEINY